MQSLPFQWDNKLLLIFFIRYCCNLHFDWEASLKRAWVKTQQPNATDIKDKQKSVKSNTDVTFFGWLHSRSEHTCMQTGKRTAACTNGICMEVPSVAWKVMGSKVNGVRPSVCNLVAPNGKKESYTLLALNPAGRPLSDIACTPSEETRRWPSLHKS